MVKTVRYSNPVLSGFYPDPSAIRVGEDYYLVTSTFEYFPGVPIFHSKDLVNWQQIGHVLHRESQVNLLERKSSQGIYAPVLRYYDGVFYMITTDVYGIGNFYVTATDPAGPWSDPIKVQYGGIDPSLFFDDDGKVYVTVQSGFGDTSHIIQYEINPQTGEASTEPVVVFEGDEGPWVEGPHLYKINGMYYMMTASGGTGPMHREIIGRSSNPYGPFELLPHPILTHNQLKDHPLQYTGHAELLDDTDGNWWVLFLGVRLRNERGSVLGRETYLAPVTWVDGWPMVDNNEGHVGLEMEVSFAKGDASGHEQLSNAELNAAAQKAVLKAAGSNSAVEQVIIQQEQPVRILNDFSTNEPLGLEWIYTRVLPTEEAVSLSANAGYLTLVGNQYALQDGKSTVYVCRRQLHHCMRVESKLLYQPRQNGEAAGIAARLSDSCFYAVGLTQQSGMLGVQATLMISGQAEQVFNPLEASALDEPLIGQSAAVASANNCKTVDAERGCELYLALQCNEQSFTLEYSLDGQSWYQLATAPSAYITPDGGTAFTGVTLGMFAHGTEHEPSAAARFAYFQYEQK